MTFEVHKPWPTLFFILPHTFLFFKMIFYFIFWSSYNKEVTLLFSTSLQDALVYSPLPQSSAVLWRAFPSCHFTKNNRNRASGGSCHILPLCLHPLVCLYHIPLCITFPSAGKEEYCKPRLIWIWNSCWEFEILNTVSVQRWMSFFIDTFLWDASIIKKCKQFDKSTDWCIISIIAI